MTRLEALKLATTKRELASILRVKASFLTHTLYIKSVSNQYYQFQIPKRSGGHRIINAPSDELKDLQSRLSELLLDCIDEINKSKKINSTLSHGFVRDRSIITNALMHVNQKTVFNIDLENFFDSFNFGRVRGFFIKNKNFLLHNDIATVLAKIACLNDTLPQGSPCSPVITNLITHSLDIRLASLAKKNSCTYSRYADDITFSTRKKSFPSALVKDNGEYNYVVGKRLKNEIINSGFSINDKKTRVQFKDSRQDVTGLVVNKKVNIKSEYWRITRAMCHQLFMTGSFTIKRESGQEEGGINELDGRLNFIDSVDRHNHTRPQGAIDIRFAPRNHGIDYRAKLNVREKTFSKFLYYRNFYGNDKPTILCEGKTDNIYLKSAINILASKYPLLAKPQAQTAPYELKINFIEYNKRTKFLLDLFGGGIYLKKFVERYINNFNYYRAPNPSQPVILLLDNDSGPKMLLNHLEDKSSKYPNCPSKKVDMRQSDFMHVTDNLYIILTPQINNGDSAIEDFFDQATLNTPIDGRKFDPKNEADTKTTYGKYTFATKVVKAKKAKISFDKFNPILEKIVKVIKHYQNQPK